MSTSTIKELRIPVVPNEIHKELKKLAKDETRPLHNMTLVLIKEALEARQQRAA